MARKARKVRKVIHTTLLVIGEGPIDRAFIQHVQSLYDSRNSGQKVKVDSGDGGCPKAVVHKAVRHKHADYDRKYVLLDDDVEIPEAVYKYAADNNIEILVSMPVCLEGMLLVLLGQSAAHTNEGCKDILHPQLAGPPTRRESYADLFTKELLEVSSHDTIVVLRKALSGQ